MPYLNSAQLAFMRDQVLDTMPDVGTIQTVTRTSDGQGGYTSVWAGTVGYECRVDVVNGRESQAGGGYKTYQKTMLTLPYDTVISTANRFTYGANTYNVIAVSGTDRSWNVTVRAELEQV